MIIFHIDVNSAFLSWSSVYMLKNGKNIDLRNIASAVGGDPKQRKGIILAKSIPAKKYGIHTGETIYSALKKCPKLVIIPPNFTIYQDYSSKFIGVIKKYINEVEQASIDECYANYTSYEKLYGDPIKFANKLKDEIKDTLGFTVNIGISENKVLAKMASDFEKPDKVHTLFKTEITEKMWKLPIDNLFMLGRKSKEKLLSRGFKTISDIANSDIKILENLFGKHGKLLWQYANGIDNSEVIDINSPLKSIRSSETLPYDILNKTNAHKEILKLCEDVCKRLLDYNFNCSLISIEIKNTKFEKYSHQKKLDFSICSTQNIYEQSIKIFDSFWKNEPIRSIAVTVGEFNINDYEQLNIFEENNDDKYKNLDKAINNIRKKYNKATIKRASLL